MTARIHILPVVRAEHDHEASLAEARDLSNVVRLDRHRRKAAPHYLLAPPTLIPSERAAELFARLWLRWMEASMKFATKPLWPGGIDDLKW